MNNDFLHDLRDLRDMAITGIEEGSEQIEFTYSDLATIAYCLNQTLFAEEIAQIRGYAPLVDHIIEITIAIVAAAERPELEKQLGKILGRENPETEGDGA